jgi:serine/threonine-protein kinase
MFTRAWLPALLVGLLVVAGFELRQARADYPRGWGGGGKDYELARDTEVKHGGTASGAIRATAEAKDGFGTFTQGIQAEKYRAKRVRLAGWIKADSVAGWSGLWMRVDGKERAALAFDNMSDRAVKDTSDWTQFQVVLDVPDAAEQIYFGCLLAGKGKVWVDDLSLEIVGNDVAATGKSLDGVPRQGEPAALPVEAANLGFEE